MAIANLAETLFTYTLRKADLQNEIMSNQARKACAVAATADANQLLEAGKADIRAKYKKLFEENPEEYGEYLKYTEIPEFEEEIAKFTARMQEEIDELAAWETNIDNEQYNLSTELEEVNAYMDSFKQMLTQNIQDDFNYAGN